MRTAIYCRWRSLSLWLAVGLLTLATVAPAGATTARVVSAAGDCTVSDADLAQNQEETALLPLINDYRAQTGLAPVQTSPTLTRAASWKARDMDRHNYLSHTDSLGRNTYQLAADCGYPHAWEVNVAEIAASGYISARSVFNAWKASPGHNAMLLWADFRAVGIGNVDGYWSVLFAERLDGPTAAPTATPVPTPAPTATAAANTTAPQVTLAQPADGQTVSGRATIRALASDDVAVVGVSFAVDGVLYKTVTSAPYEVSWNTRKWRNGVHTLTARAFDAAGNAATDTRTVTVGN